MLDKYSLPQERFEYAINIILQHEGGYADNSSDPGGVTDYGISLRFLQKEGIDVNHDRNIYPQDIKALSREEAIVLYKKYWWDPYHYAIINSLKIVTKIFDMAVNMGAVQAHKLTQQALNRCGTTLTVDGILGANTLKAVNDTCLRGFEGNLLSNIIDEQKCFYEQLVKDKPNLKVFLKGWLARAEY